MPPLAHLTRPKLPVWQRLSSAPPLDAGEIHLWRLRRTTSPVVIRRLTRALSPDETDRANRYSRSADRSDFLIYRGWLRLVLGGYLGVAPERIAFAYGPRGKPRLDGEHSGIEFNLSHSGPIAVIGLSSSHALGVDVECERRRVDAAALARRVFPPPTAERIAELPAFEARRDFLGVWTRIEACTKALGQGIFDGRDEGRWKGWETVRFEAAPGFGGAVAFPAGLESVRWRFCELLL